MTRQARSRPFLQAGLIATVLALLLGSACTLQPSTPADPPELDPASGDSPMPASDGESPRPDQGIPPRAAYVVRVTIMTVEVPVNQASGSKMLWSILDEEPLSLKSHVLGLNGFRVGLGQAELWPDVRAMLEDMTGKKIKVSTFQALAGEPGSIVLGKLCPARLFFVYHEDRSLTGRDYPPGDDLLSISCGIDPDDRSRVLLTALPQLRTSRRYRQVVQNPAQPPRIVTLPRYIPFEPMTFQLRIDRGDFLVIGPGIEARRPNSPGHHMLTDQREGMTFERILVFQPEVLLQEVPATPQPTAKPAPRGQ